MRGKVCLAYCSARAFRNRYEKYLITTGLLQPVLEVDCATKVLFVRPLYQKLRLYNQILSVRETLMDLERLACQLATSRDGPKLTAYLVHANLSLPLPPLLLRREGGAPIAVVLPRAPNSLHSRPIWQRRCPCCQGGASGLSY